jgi:hypothetical protein
MSYENPFGYAGKARSDEILKTWAAQLKSLQSSAKGDITTLTAAATQAAATLVDHEGRIIAIDPANNGITVQAGWTPALTGTGSMTVTADDIQVAKFWDVGELTWFKLRASFTTGGTANTSIIVPLPGGYSQPFDFVTSLGGGTVVDGGAGVDAQVLAHSATEFVVNRFDSANWSLGANRRIIVWGFFQRV